MKIKTSPTSPNFREEKENAILKIYNNDNIKKIEKAKSAHPGIFTIVFLSIIFGFVAGLLSIILFLMYGSEIPLLKDIGFADNLSQTLTIIKQQKNNIIQNNTMIQQAVEKVRPATVDIFLKKTAKDTDLDRIYLDNEKKGEGAILTNDGLIITTSQVIDNLNQEYVVITADKKIYPVINYLEDQVTNTIFLKIDALNLPVIDIVNPDDLNNSDEIIILQNNINNYTQDVLLTRIKNLNFKQFKIQSDLIENSEKFSGAILIENNFDFSASPVINLEGKLIGLTWKNEKYNEVFPIQYIESILNGVLKNNSIERPYLGVRYINLSKAVNITDELSQSRNKGALIFSQDNKIPGIEPNSPAQKAGLKENDIILKVNDLEIDQKNDLTSYIQDFNIGDIVNLTILRNKVEQQVKVELDKTPINK